MHRFKKLLTWPVMAGAIAVLGLAGGGGYALASSSPFVPQGCVQPDAALGGRVLANVYTTQTGWSAFLARNGGKCPHGGFAVPVGGGTGAPGAPGVGVLNGKTVPTATTPGTRAGAFYIDTVTDAIYGPYSASDTTNGGWGNAVSLVGKSVSVTKEPPGANCPNGGLAVTDDTPTQYVCNGTNGKDGVSTVLTVSASTAVSNWPESSGWATDNFTRNVTLTREGAVPASDCGSTATSCYLYTETMADNGSFTTVDGHASPNGSSTAKITGAWTGTLTGGGKLELYASSDSPDPKLVPGTADGSAKPQTTTDWYKLFFPSSTSFGLTSGLNVPWLSYDWNYAVTVPCGSASSQAENWNDGINPGHDGQDSADGNITGSTACTTS